MISLAKELWVPLHDFANMIFSQSLPTILLSSPESYSLLPLSVHRLFLLWVLSSTTSTCPASQFSSATPSFRKPFLTFLLCKYFHHSTYHTDMPLSAYCCVFPICANSLKLKLAPGYWMNKQSFFSQSINSKMNKTMNYLLITLFGVYTLGSINSEPVNKKMKMAVL